MKHNFFYFPLTFTNMSITYTFSYSSTLQFSRISCWHKSSFIFIINGIVIILSMLYTIEIALGRLNYSHTLEQHMSLVQGR